MFHSIHVKGLGSAFVLVRWTHFLLARVMPISTCFPSNYFDGVEFVCCFKGQGRAIHVLIIAKFTNRWIYSKSNLKLLWWLSSYSFCEPIEIDESMGKYRRKGKECGQVYKQKEKYEHMCKQKEIYTIKRRYDEMHKDCSLIQMIKYKQMPLHKNPLTL